MSEKKNSLIEQAQNRIAEAHARQIQTNHYMPCVIVFPGRIMPMDNGFVRMSTSRMNLNCLPVTLNEELAFVKSHCATGITEYIVTDQVDPEQIAPEERHAMEQHFFPAIGLKVEKMLAALRAANEK